jgi:hypothetical protein
MIRISYVFTISPFISGRSPGERQMPDARFCSAGNVFPRRRCKVSRIKNAKKSSALCSAGSGRRHHCACEEPFTLDKRGPASYAFPMGANAHKFVVLVLALALAVGIAPMAVAGTSMVGCDMSMASMDMPMSMSRDQHAMPMQKQQTPSKDKGDCCMATCSGAIGLPHVGYSPVLASKPVVSGWPVQAEWANTRSRPELPPPIALL